jgi:adenylate cyclase
MSAWHRSAIGALLVLLLARLFGVSEGLNTWITDAHWTRKASVRPTPFPSNIVVIAIDDSTVRHFGRLRYWSRARYAELLDRLGQAKAVAIDILFTEPDLRDTIGDKALVKAIRSYKNVVLPCYEWTQPPPVDNEILKTREALLNQLPKAKGIISQTVNPLLIEPPFPELFNPRKIGSATVNSDSDGVYRSPVIIKQTYNGGLLPNISLTLSAMAVDAPIERVVQEGYFDLAGRIVPHVNGQIMMEPIATRGGSYSNRIGSPVPTISFMDALALPASAFKDKIILIGETATGTTDVRPSPLDNGLRGVELNAQIVANLLYLNSIRPLPAAIQWLLIIVAIVLPILMYERLQSSRANIGAAIGLILLISIMETLFWGGRLVPSWSSVILGFAASSLLMALQRYAQEEALKRSLRHSFSMYVAPELVEQIVRRPDIAQREGTRREVAILFSDIRDFTPYCEHHSPEFVVSQMRVYLDEMTAAVEENGGVLDKFIGDSVMALFGPFIPDEDNKSAAAISCALNMQSRLTVLNRQWEETGMPKLRMGIGIHTGEAIVGNVGAQKRMQYTALGDTVNLSARLESVTKDLKADIIVSDAVKNQAQEDLNNLVEFLHRGPVSVKGREQSVEVYEVRVKDAAYGG